MKHDRIRWIDNCFLEPIPPRRCHWGELGRTKQVVGLCTMKLDPMHEYEPQQSIIAASSIAISLHPNNGYLVGEKVG